MTENEKLCVDLFNQRNIVSWESWDDYKACKHPDYAMHTPTGFIKELLDIGVIESENEGWQFVYGCLKRIYP